MNDLIEKDFDILYALHKYRRHTAELLLYVTPFKERNRCNETLNKLTKQKYISRVSWHDLNAPAGRAQYVYSLTQRGMNALSDASGIPSKRIRKLRGKSQHIAHILAINRFRICLENACKNHPSVQLAGLITEYDANEKSNETFARITAQKVSGPPGRSRIFTFIPDLIFTLERNGAYALFFVEIDLGTEPMKLLREKVMAYDRYYDEEGYSEYNTFFGGQFSGFRILFVGAPDQFIKLVKRLDKDGMDTGFLWGFDIAKLNSISPLDKAWLVGGRPFTNHYSIIEEESS
jgi:hypothetical protein